MQIGETTFVGRPYKRPDSSLSHIHQNVPIFQLLYLTHHNSVNCKICHLDVSLYACSYACRWRKIMRKTGDVNQNSITLYKYKRR